MLRVVALVAGLTTALPAIAVKCPQARHANSSLKGCLATHVLMERAEWPVSMPTVR